MIGFENFDIRTWLEYALVKPVPSKRITKAAIRSKSWDTVLVVTLAACGMTVLESNVVDVRPLVSWGAPSRVCAEETPSLLSDEVPVGYWPKLMSAIDAWKPLDEVTLSEPDPIV